jgi:hypothetical protein
MPMAASMMTMHEDVHEHTKQQRHIKEGGKQVFQVPREAEDCTDSRKR